MGQYSVGQSVSRMEDPRLLRGQGKYLDDLRLDRQVHAHILRSPHAHARINGVDAEAARAAPGVLAILTGAEYLADGLGTLPADMPRRQRNGDPMFQPTRRAIATDRAAHVGMAVAIVVAETLAQAKDATELIQVDYQPLPVNVDTGAARATDTAPLWEDCAGNEAFLHAAGDREAVDRAFDAAAHVVSHRFMINRISACTMETRGCLGEYDPGTERYTLHTGLQRPYLFRKSIAEMALFIQEPQLRLVAPDIGGSFGLRGSIYPEMILTLWAAKRVGRPVKWICERSESFVSDDHARDNVTEAALALDADGKFLALRAKTDANLGAFMSFRGAGPPVSNIGSLAGVYTTPALYVEVSGVLTNTNPTSPYRGAGRPEAAFVIESLVDMAARKTGIDPAELRRRNTIPADSMPYKTGLTFTYDSGEFEKNMDMGLAMADYAGFEARRAEASARGRLRGIGISNTIEQAAGASIETAELRFDPSGTLTLVAGSVSHGQGHQTVWTQILSEKLGIDSDKIRMIQGDTDKIAFAMGTGGSRSATLSGSATLLVCDKVIEKGKKIAAHVLEAAEDDMVFADGAFTVAGTDRSMDMLDVAKTAFQPGKLPDDIEPGLYETATYREKTGNFPNGCHVCEVEIDPDTGTTEILRYSVVDDVGTVLNPLLLKGQILGGIAQGVGQALMEDIAYDRDSGQMLSGSFMDYAMPRADVFCNIDITSNPVPTTTNPLGVKGGGEAGTVGALPAVMNAIADALAPLNAAPVNMPATPERVWRAIADAKA